MESAPSTLLYDRGNPSANAPGAYARAVQRGGLYAIALARDADTPVSATVEFPYRLVANLGSVHYYMLDPTAARDPDEAAFMRAYASESGAVTQFGPAAYTLAIEIHPGPSNSVRLVARAHPAAISPDRRFYIGRTVDVDTVRRVDTGPTFGSEGIRPATQESRQQSVPASLRTERQRREAAALVRLNAPARGSGDAVLVGDLGDQGPNDRPLRQQPEGASASAVQTRGQTGTMNENEPLRSYEPAPQGEPLRPPNDPRALGEYRRRRMAQLEGSVEWVQSLQQRRTQLAAEALDRARAQASQEARARAEAQLEDLAQTMGPTRLAAAIRHRRAEIADAIVDQAAIDAIQREATAQARAEIGQAVRDQIEREITAGVFYGGLPPVREEAQRQRRRPRQQPAVPRVDRERAGAPEPSLPTRGSIEIDVQPQPAAASSGSRLGSTTRSRRNSDAVTRAVAMSGFQDAVAQRLAHLSDDSPTIRDIIAQWSTATESKTSGLSPAMLRERAVQWWASQRWADIEPGERARYIEEAKARSDSFAVVAAEAAVRRRLEESAADAAARASPAPLIAQRSRRRPRRSGSEGEEALDESEQARREAQRMAAAPPSAKRARRSTAIAAGPPPMAMITSGGDVVEVPRPALAPVPMPVGALAGSDASTRSFFGAAAASAQARSPTQRASGQRSASIPLGVSRLRVPGSGLLGRTPSAPSPLTPASVLGQPREAETRRSSPTEDVASRIRDLALAQSQRAVALQRQTATQWALGL
jgi:hypothetical protein